MKVIFLDLGGVIFKTKGIEKAFINLINEELIEEQNDKAKRCKKEFIRLMNGIIDDNEFYNNMSLITKKDVNYCKKFVNFIEYHINIDLIIRIKNLKSKIRIGIISDTTNIIYKLVEDNIQNMYDIFDKDLIFLSYIEKDSKYLGEVGYFEKIIKKLSIEPKDIIFIDDEIKNIENAKKCGIRTIHYDKYNEEIAENKKIIKSIKKEKRFDIF